MLDQRARQRALIRRSEALERARFQAAARALAYEIAHPDPPIYLHTTPATRVEFHADYGEILDDFYRAGDPDLGSFDAMRWEAEEEIEKWEDFVQELKDRHHK